ncbi:spore germination protein GerPE [Gorillibacterium sp. sgz5001074]|uniref:spore germination protein GerPE n=1 Tax=Gorillibacterium sp. sgz5001074 TaxID=3446695 RepID=UPI003F675980
MPVRSSLVGGIRILSAQLSSIVQLGDSAAVAPRSEVLAVQREVANYEGNEGGFDAFAIYRQNLLRPVVYEPVAFTAENECSSIRVGAVEILGMSVSAVLHVGSCKAVDSENRTKHIRQLLSGKRPV